MHARSFWGRVVPTGFCWEWEGAHSEGYGTYWDGKRGSARAHRFAYEQLVGPIPEGMFLDHLCRNPGCVNPDHLEPVTNSENLLRSPRMNRYVGMTHCKRGHEFTPENTGITSAGARRCRACERERYRRRKLMKLTGETNERESNK